jgi:hypothetical protein
MRDTFVILASRSVALDLSEPEIVKQSLSDSDSSDICGVSGHWLVVECDIGTSEVIASKDIYARYGLVSVDCSQIGYGLLPSFRPKIEILASHLRPVKKSELRARTG